MFRSLKDFNFHNKRVLVRCDFNAPIKNGKVSDDFRIQRALPIINYLKEAGAKIILLSHLGRPWDVKSKGERIKKYTLKPVQQKLEELLKEEIGFSKKIVGRGAEKAAQRVKNGKILLLENLRFEKGEEKNDKEFAKSLAELGNCFIEEAFSVCHRVHASIAALPKLLPCFVGLELEKEIEVLSGISQNPARPLVGIIGGVKIASKIKVIKECLETADHLLIGGRIANIILRVKGICIGKPWPEEPIVKEIKKLSLTDPKLHLPIDALASPDQTGEIYIRETGPGSVRKEESIFDIGRETIQTFGDIIKSAKTIFWSGPLGLAENEKFNSGTKEIGRIIVRNHAAFKVVGGGDTIAILKEFNLLDKFSYVSTGGSAMLALLAREKLPGIEALKV